MRVTPETIKHETFGGPCSAAELDQTAHSGKFDDNGNGIDTEPEATTSRFRLATKPSSHQAQRYPRWSLKENPLRCHTRDRGHETNKIVDRVSLMADRLDSQQDTMIESLLPGEQSTGVSMVVEPRSTQRSLVFVPL